MTLIRTVQNTIRATQSSDLGMTRSNNMTRSESKPTIYCWNHHQIIQGVNECWSGITPVHEEGDGSGSFSAHPTAAFTPVNFLPCLRNGDRNMYRAGSSLGHIVSLKTYRTIGIASWLQLGEHGRVDTFQKAVRSLYWSEVVTRAVGVRLATAGMPSLTPPTDRCGFTIGIICALDIEADAVLNVLDVNWKDSGQTYGRSRGDQNNYTTGAIGDHNVVLAHMPGMGLGSATIAASNLRQSFSNVQLILLVGICGGVPSASDHGEDIFLGDLIIGTAVVQFDFGRQYPAGIVRKDASEDNIGRPNQDIRGFVAQLKTQTYRQRIQSEMSDLLDVACNANQSVVYPGLREDHLYDASYVHKHRNLENNIVCAQCNSNPIQFCAVAASSTCSELGCETIRRIDRHRDQHGQRSDNLQHRPGLHFGRFGSGNLVLKSAEHRDQIARQDHIIAFEMESAGVCDVLPTMVIKAVCDYADSHKNKQWQRYSAAVAAAGAKAVLRIRDREDTPPHRCQQSTTQANNIACVQGNWFVPFARDPDFVGRGQILHQLDDIFADLSYSPRVTLTGLGGVGKTQLAIEYAHHYRTQYPETSIFYVHASNLARFRAGYQAIARNLQLPDLHNPEIDPLDIVYQWLQSEANGKCLLIFDNVDDISQIQYQSSDGDSSSSILRYLPQRAGVAVLVTSRDTQVGATFSSQGDYTISVPVMSKDDAFKLAQRRIGVDRTDEENLARLCLTLDYLPLAITQATAYISRRQRMTISKYIELVNKRDVAGFRVLTEEFADLRRDWQASNSVFRSWEVSFTQIQKHSELAVQLLSLMAIFDRQGIPEALLRASCPSDDFDDAIELLLDYAFVSLEGDGSSFSTHRLVQLATEAWLLNTNSWTRSQEQALESLAELYPEPGHHDWEQCELLEPHVDRALRGHGHPQAASLHRGHVLRKRARYYVERGYSLLAATYCQDALKLFEHLAPEDDSIPDLIQLKAVLKSGQGRHAEAEQLSRTAHEKYLQRWGPDDIKTLDSSRLIGYMLSSQRKHYEAEQQLRSVLTKAIDLFGSDHVLTMNCRWTLAQVLFTQEQEQIQEAEELFRVVLDHYIKHFGPRHDKVLESRMMLAIILCGRSEHDEAEILIRDVLEVRCRALEFEHPETLCTRVLLATILCKKGQFFDAQNMLRDASPIAERVTGLAHPTFMGYAVTQAHVHIGLGEYDSAEQLYRRLLDNLIKTHGTKHMDTMQAVRRLGRTLASASKHAEAIEAFEKAANISLELLGPGDGDTVACQHELREARAAFAQINETQS